MILAAGAHVALFLAVLSRCTQHPLTLTQINVLSKELLDLLLQGWVRTVSPSKLTSRCPCLQLAK